MGIDFNSEEFKSLPKWKKKEIVIQEFKKCKDDFQYFAENYLRLRHPQAGIIKPKLFEYQYDVLIPISKALIYGRTPELYKELAKYQYKFNYEKWLKEVIENNIELIKYIPFEFHYFYRITFKHPEYPFYVDTIILKSRQTGISTAFQGLNTWDINFHPNHYNLVISQRDKEAIKYLNDVRQMYELLPAPLRAKKIKSNDHELFVSLKGRDYISGIQALAPSPDAGRSYSPNLVVLDEFAMYKNAEDVYTAVSMALSTGGVLVIISTPKGVGNLYHRLWETSKKYFSTYINTIPQTSQSNTNKNENSLNNKDILDDIENIKKILTELEKINSKINELKELGKETDENLLAQKTKLESELKKYKLNVENILDLEIKNNNDTNTTNKGTLDNVNKDIDKNNTLSDKDIEEIVKRLEFGILKPYVIHWTQIPLEEFKRRGFKNPIDWYKFMANKLRLEGGERKVAQELDLSFELSGETLIPIEILKDLRKRVLDYRTLNNKLDKGTLEVINSVIDKTTLSKLKIFELPKDTALYVLGVDVSEGVGNDYSVVYVLKVFDDEEIEKGINTIVDKNTGETKYIPQVVAVYSNNKISPTDFAKVVIDIGKLYNYGFINFEKNNHGFVLHSEIVEQNKYNYPDFLILNRYDVSRGKFVKGEKGWRTTKTSKLYLLTTLKSFILDNYKYISLPETLLDEMLTFYEEKYHDDQVIAYSLALTGYNLLDKYIEFLKNEEYKDNFREILEFWKKENPHLPNVDYFGNDNVNENSTYINTIDNNVNNTIRENNLSENSDFKLLVESKFANVDIIDDVPSVVSSDFVDSELSILESYETYKEYLEVRQRNQNNSVNNDLEAQQKKENQNNETTPTNKETLKNTLIDFLMYKSKNRFNSDGLSGENELSEFEIIKDFILSNLNSLKLSFQITDKFLNEFTEWLVNGLDNDDKEFLLELIESGELTLETLLELYRKHRDRTIEILKTKNDVDGLEVF